MTEVAFEVVGVESPRRIGELRELFAEYATLLRARHGACCLAAYEAEMAGLPGEYAAPGGTALLCHADGRLAGCGVLRKAGPATAEMKRLYIRPAFRGRHLGRRLAVSLMQEARQLGYERVVLETLPAMTEAVSLYRSLGFAETAPYSEGHPGGAVCLELRLAEGRP